MKAEQGMSIALHRIKDLELQLEAVSLLFSLFSFFFFILFNELIFFLSVLLTLPSSAKGATKECYCLRILRGNGKAEEKERQDEGGA